MSACVAWVGGVPLVIERLSALVCLRGDEDKTYGVDECIIGVLAASVGFGNW